jgi:hypothetical protein
MWWQQLNILTACEVFDPIVEGCPIKQQQQQQQQQQ